jgi:3-oxoacyl-[acyl-carrier-protein] synthase II
MGAALAPLGLEGQSHPRMGAIVGEAFGAVDDCAAFVHRIYDKGPRFASPATFPNLLPSSPVAHASIYHRLNGPVFATADLGATSECAIITSAELIAAGEADAMIAGGVEQGSDIIAAVLGPLCSGPAEARRHRSEGSAVLVLESGASLEARGGTGLARVAWTMGWRGAVGSALAALPQPGERAALVVARDDGPWREALTGTGWLDVPHEVASRRAGDHEGAGGFGAAAAVARIAAGVWREALVLGLAPDRGYVILLTALT